VDPVFEQIFTGGDSFPPAVVEVGDAQERLSPSAKSQFGPSVTGSPIKVASTLRGPVVAAWACTCVAQAVTASRRNPKARDERGCIEVTIS
jgi:hypothetical protein